MKIEAQVKDLMEDIFNYPHMPYWFTVRQGMDMMKRSIPGEGSDIAYYPPPVLVFDEKYNLLGSVSVKDIIIGLEPDVMKPSPVHPPAHEESDVVPSADWDALFGDAAHELADRPLSDVMVPAKLFIGPEEFVAKAAYLMIHNDLVILPVLERKMQLVGVVRLTRIFEAIAEPLLAD